MKKIVIWLTFLTLLTVISSHAANIKKEKNQNTDENNAAQALPSTPEEPTCANGWRELKPDESVVAGAHVQMNMQTGKKHVKEPCFNEEIKSDNKLNDDFTKSEKEESKVLMMERILYGLPQPDPRLPSLEDKKKMTPEEYQNALDIIWRFRQSEVKKGLESIQKDDKIIANYTDLLINTDLSNKKPNIQKVYDALLNLEHLVSDIDLALYFTKIGGIDACTRLLNHKDIEVRKLAAHVVGNAVKNHQEMQGIAKKSGFLMKAISRLNELSPCNSQQQILETNEISKECSKMLYSISSITRGCLENQKYASESNIFLTLTKLIQYGSNDYKSIEDNKLLIKTYALISDSFDEWEGSHNEWKVNNTYTKLCNALSHKANILKISPYGSSNLNQNVKIPPNVKQLAVKLAKAIRSANCDDIVIDSSTLFSPTVV